MSSHSPSPRRASIARRVFATLTVLSIGALGALVALKARAHRDWPAPSSALTVEPPPPFARRDAWPAFEAAIAALPAGRNRAALSSAEPDAQGASLIEPYSAALSRFDVALALDRAPVIDEPPLDSRESNPFFALLELSRARSLAARLAAQQGRGDEALRVGLQLARLGARCAHGGASYMATTVAGAIEAQGFLALQSGLAGTPSVESLAQAARTMDELLAIETALPRALAGDCRARERLIESFRGQTAGALLSTSTFERRGEIHRGSSIVPVSWLFDPDATIAAIRAECHRADAALRRPRGQRSIPAAPRYAREGSLELGQWLDNRVGRVLLSIAELSTERYVARDDDTYAARYAARAAVAIAAFRAAQQRLPATLAELALPASPQPLPPPRALQWNAATRTLSVEIGASARALHSRWQFAP